MDKLIVNERGEATISSAYSGKRCKKRHLRNPADIFSTDDGATLLKLLDIVHPAARTLVDIARAQDAEVGDGTTSVTLLAAEILKEVRPYIEEGVGVHTIIKGLREGRNMAMKKLAEIAVTIDKSDPV